MLIIMTLFQIYAERRRNILEGNGISRQDIAILRDGFTEFQVKYKVITFSV